MRFAFQSQLRRFYKTKSLTQGLDHSGQKVDDQDEYKSQNEDSEIEDEQKEDELAIFTKDHVGEIADN